MEIAVDSSLPIALHLKTHMKSFAFKTLLLAVALLAAFSSLAIDANRLTYLDDADPFYPSLSFPKLTTPQWIGEPEVEAVVVLAIDDMQDTKKYETFLRPILDRLKKIDGRAPVSIMSCRVDPNDPQLQSWLREGLSIEVHTLDHPCPLFAKGDFDFAAKTVHGCVDLMNKIPDSKPVAYRMPCCDSINSLSPRFFAEIFNRTSAEKNFLSIDTSVFNITTTNDASLPHELKFDSDGKEKFRKYVPFPSFCTTVEDYPYPYVIGKMCWEFPCAVPSDWEAQNILGSVNPQMLADWKSMLDVIVLKQGTFNFVFHPHGWSSSQQLVEFIDYAATKYGKKVKFLNFREALERLNKNLLLDQPLRAANGQKQGIRLVDLNNDGFIDVLIGNENVRKTRFWNNTERKWIDSDFPMPITTAETNGDRHDMDIRFGILQPNGFASMIERIGQSAAGVSPAEPALAGGWNFDGEKWVEDKNLLNGLETDGSLVCTRQNGVGCGVRLRDVDKDGRCELIVGNEKQNAVFSWSSEEKKWNKLPFALPKGAAIGDAAGHDLGLRFVDINGDGYEDVIWSNEKNFGIYTFFAKKDSLGFDVGWSREIVSGNRGDEPSIPLLMRGGPHRHNGFWFKYGHLWIQNEDTAKLPDIVDRRSFKDLLASGQPKPKSPQESLACLKARPGFKIELVASEPLTKSPVAFDWGADGKLWVVEMGDYPLGIDGNGKSGGIVRFLEDTNADGIYDKSTVFLDGVNFPNGIIPWRKGVIVSAAPEIFYAEDLDGDGKADLRKTLFRGFNEGNQQHRANGFDYGLDNFLYGANGDSSGEIESVLARTKASISGRDFRFRPDDGTFETQAGQTQFGRHRDDWGNWFGNNNSVWLWHYFLPTHYLPRNPHLSVGSTSQHTATYADQTRVFPTSKTPQRFNGLDSAGHLTSGNSAMPYRDELFGPDFATSVFISEPVHNLVHREVLESDGVSFKSHRAADEQGTEFLTSSDNWFRPTQIKTGPDGALYVADMYRLVIEHPEWIPKEIQKQYDLRAGADCGRIYRIYPDGATLRKIPRLDKMSTAELVAALDSPNGWQRDTAQRLLVHAQDKTAIKPLENQVKKSSRAKTRMQALCTLDGLNALTPEIVVLGLKDSEAHVREQAVRASEKLISKNPKVGVALTTMADDPEIRVRYQLAFSLGEWNDPRAGATLAKIALRDADSKATQTAVMSSATNHVAEMLATIFSEKNPSANLVEQLLGLATAMNDEKAFEKVLGKVAQPDNGKFHSWQLAALAGFLDALDRRGVDLKKFHETATKDLQREVGQLDGIFSQARQLAADPQITEAKRLLAIRLLGRGIGNQEDDLKKMGELLGPLSPGALQKAALASLKRCHQKTVAEILVAGWKGYLPETRGEVMNILLSRAEWTQTLLGAIEQQQIPAGQIATAFQQKLLTHTQAPIRELAKKIFAETNRDRKKLVEQYQTVSGLKGDASKGATLFQQNCTPCHRLRGNGNDVGPDLGASSSKGVDALLIAILDPNQAIEARYIAYNVVTKNERELSGIISAETPTSITLKIPGGAEEIILRSDLKELSSSGLSLMPEGLEKALNPQATADLISYVQSSGPPPKKFPGNKPETVKADDKGALHLRASNAEIFGETIAFEDNYKNLGYWQSASDRAVWSMEIPKAGAYDLVLDFAAPSENGNQFEVAAGDAVLRAGISATGSWDEYRRKNFGRVELKAGWQRLSLSGVAPLHGAIFDVREVRLTPASEKPASAKEKQGAAK